jgi:NAD(P)H dehydrogenase (quinone)
MILVTGATGAFGSATIHHLLAQGIAANQIAALVRDEAKAAELTQLGVAVRPGDYDDYASLVQAFTGVEKVLLVSGSDIFKCHSRCPRSGRETPGVHQLFR